MEKKINKSQNNLKNIKRLKIAEKTTYWGMVVNLLLVIFKFIGGFMGNSYAMVADSIHSLSDFISDFGVILGVKAAKRPADECHNYGHGKYETFVTLGISILLFAVAGGIIFSAIKSIINIANHKCSFYIPKLIALIAAFVSIIVKEVLFRYTKFYANKINSKALLANAWHHRSDALSSIASLLGIAGAMFLGYKWVILDPIASIVVSVMLVFTAKKIFVDSFYELVDAALPKKQAQKIIETIKNVPNVYNPHKLRTRKVGNSVSIEFHIEVNPQMSVFNAHKLADEIEKMLLKKFGEDTIINIHIEPKRGKNV